MSAISDAKMCSAPTGLSDRLKATLDTMKQAETVLGRVEERIHGAIPRPADVCAPAAPASLDGLAVDLSCCSASILELAQKIESSL